MVPCVPLASSDTDSPSHHARPNSRRARRRRMSVAAHFSLRGRVVAITGRLRGDWRHAGRGLAAAGARVALVDRNAAGRRGRGGRTPRAGGEALLVVGDVLDDAQMRAARDEVMSAWGRVDILVNAAGGNVARARSDDRPIFDVPLDAFDEVLRLNLHGTRHAVASSSARRWPASGSGCIVNISSMAASRALSGVLGLLGRQGRDRQLHALDGRGTGPQVRRRRARQRHRARASSSRTQNRAVLRRRPTAATPTRSRTIIDQTPMGRFGAPRGAGRRRAVAVQRRRLVRDRHGHPGGRRLQRLQRRLRRNRTGLKIRLTATA